MRRAECNIITNPTAAVSLKTPIAIVPQVDMVEVLDIKRRLHSPTGQVVDFIGEGIRRKVDEGWVDADVGGVGAEEVEVVEGAVALVCTT